MKVEITNKSGFEFTHIFSISWQCKWTPISKNQIKVFFEDKNIESPALLVYVIKGVRNLENTDPVHIIHKSKDVLNKTYNLNVRF